MHIPWRFQILSSLLDFDFVGFQTVKDGINFSGCVKRLIKPARPRGKGQVVELGVDDRTVRLGAFAISVDLKAFSKQARNREVAEKTSLIHKNLPDSKTSLPQYGHECISSIFFADQCVCCSDEELIASCHAVSVDGSAEFAGTHPAAERHHSNALDHGIGKF